MKLPENLKVKSFVFLLFLLFSLCCRDKKDTIPNSSRSSEDSALLKDIKPVDLGFQFIVSNVSRKFFKDSFAVKALSYEYPQNPELNFKNKYRAESISLLHRSAFNRSRGEVGNSKAGYIWLNNLLMDDLWYEVNGKNEIKPEIFFLIGHELTHNAHYVDDRNIYQSQVVRLNGKMRVMRYRLNVDEEGNDIGFFEDIPAKLMDPAKELHGDYAGGMILFDFVLFESDYWMRSENAEKRELHTRLYDSIVNRVSDFIRKELASDERLYDTPETRVQYFLKGLNERRKHFHKVKDSRIPYVKLKNNDFSYNILLPLRNEAKKIRELYRK